jgi:hypothetical protein
MIHKRILNPERLRRVPASFSYLDHRLVRQGYLQRADAKAWALYLVLVAVGDEYGLSYYSERALGSLLALPLSEIAAARRRLEAADVLAYEAPLYQVLALDGARAAIPEEARR